MITAAIIDDEVHVRETIIHMLSAYCPNVKVVGQASSIESGYKLIKVQKPNVVFLDVKLHDGTGYELIKMFTKVDFLIIVVTAYEEYAIQAFKANALDYILKPVDPSDLINAVKKASTALKEDETKNQLDRKVETIEDKKHDAKKVVLKTIDNVFVIEVDEIIRCESDNNSTLFYLKSGSTIKVSKTLKEYEETLLPFSFIRCHQTHLVNPNFILKFEKHPNPILELNNGDKIPVSFRKKEIVEEIVKTLKGC